MRFSSSLGSFSSPRAVHLRSFAHEDLLHIPRLPLTSRITLQPWHCSQSTNRRAEKTGIPRVLEALESNDWAQGDLDGALDSDDDDFGDFTGQDSQSASRKDTDLDPESLEFGFDREDFEGLKRAIWTSGQEVDVAAAPIVGASNDTSTVKEEGKSIGEGEGEQQQQQKAEDEKLDDEEVAKIERMMLKLSAVRDMAAGLPEDQKRRMAAKAVNEVMKEL